ncbi:VCBS repeat-containing protein [Glycomyces luteolus]|uniref:VCBS repeat-containing protein n=1 Tax=Glycomyces luteolus TaxID=2670330 RepID=A0A9X3PBD4_9ACTN|nr:VCBS repeat-containing protein [Glycomyces luteolus]MDA1362226.1 VCBS repeat-containing protein [Glycomyces luteolus]
MSPDSPRARRAGLRLLAAAAAGCTAAAAFAVPASAVEIPGISGDPVASVHLAPDFNGAESAPSTMTVDYVRAVADDTTTHAVVSELVFDDPYGVLDLTTEDPACEVSEPATIVCSADAEPHTDFVFNLAPVPNAEDAAIDYTFKATVDGIEVENSTGEYRVIADYDVHHPYAHGDVAVSGVVEDTFTKVNPVFYQDFDLAPTTAAVVVTFSNPLPGGGIDPSELADAIDFFPNCRTTYEGSGSTLTQTGIVCVITDVPDAKGQFLTLTKAVDYRIANGVVGPLDVCRCTYSVETINAATLAEEYDNLSWVPATGTKLGLATAPAGWEGGEDSIAYYSGAVTITTADNTYDLEAEETFLKGMVGDTVTVTTEIANNGPGATQDLNEESGSYLLRAQLPEGTELVRVDSDGGGLWECYDAGELDAVYAATPDTALERFDFACTVDEFGYNETPDLTFTVKLTDTTAFQGAIEVGAVYGDGEYEGDPSNDFALIYNDAHAARYDYNQDDHEDLLVVRKSDGALVLYKGTSSGKYLAGVVVGSDWGKMDIVMAGDLTGDGIPDLLARDNKLGNLWTYPGNGSGGFKSRIFVGNGWGKMGQIAVGNFDGDGNPDIFATSFTDGNMYYYPGLGDGKFGARVFWSEFWNGMDVISSVGDLDDDGYDEFLSRWNYDGRYYLYASTGGVIELDPSLYVGDDTRRFDQVVGVGDLTRDGTPDIVAPNLRNGQLIRYTIDTEWSGYDPGTVIGSSGWNAMRLPVIQLDRTYDYDYNGFSDVVAQRKSDKDLYLYWGTTTGIGSRWNLCDNCTGITSASAGGDYNSDGRTDLLYRTSTGDLYVAPGLDTGEAGFANAIRVGSGWNSMSAITGGHDFNSDGKDDLVARASSTGYLYLYPGNGNGTFGSRKQIGTGWNGMREISAVGDMNHDGYADVLAVRSSNSCLYLYAGNGNGTVKSGVEVTCGWGGYDQITGVGDFNRDGHADWLARRTSDGALYLYKGNGSGGYGSRQQIGTGWNGMSYLA